MLEEILKEVIDNKYRIEKKLGQGAMGTVYLATHTGTDRVVALKIIFPQSLSPEYIRRFQQEAKAAGRLRHPNIINVTDFGFTSFKNKEIAYLVMEYLEGITLSEILKKTTILPLTFIVDIIEQISLGIHKAHDKGIIHRDLKPENIWLEFNGRKGYNVKILDFGIVKLREIENVEPTSSELNLENSSNNIVSEETVENHEKNLTRTNQLLGTPTYMSPEQCNSKDASRFSDIYSIGVVTYEMVTGIPPFSGDNIYTLIYKHAKESPPSIIERRADVPKLVEEIIFSALSKDATERPKSALAFGKALRVAAENEADILSQAIRFYVGHFYSVIVYSTIIYFPLIIGHVLLGTILITWQQARESFPIFLVFYFYFAGCFLWVSIIHGKIFTPFVKENSDVAFDEGLLKKNNNNAATDIAIYKTQQHLKLKDLMDPDFIKQLRVYLRNMIKDISIIIGHFTLLLLIAGFSLFWLFKCWYTYFFITGVIFICYFYYFPDLLVSKIDNNFLIGPIFFLEKKTSIEARERSKALRKCFNSLAKRKVFPLITLIVVLAPYFAVAFTWLLSSYTKHYPLLANIIWLIYGVTLIIMFSLCGLLLGPLIPIIKSFDYLKVCEIEDLKLRGVKENYD